MKYLFFCGLNGNLNAVFFFFETKALTCLLKLHNKANISVGILQIFRTSYRPNHLLKVFLYYLQHIWKTFSLSRIHA